jgi:membrane-associated protease RseP (regulator of RpoE activity)
VEAAPLFAPKSRWKEYGRPALLFVVTMATVYLHGAFSIDDHGFLFHQSMRDGLVLVAGVFSIMVAHEMGHYLACRYYGVDATVPHLLPAPPLFIGFHMQPLIISIVGTFGAFIRIRGPMPHRKALFDIGVAGPLAGFIVTVGVLALTIATATVGPPPAIGAEPQGVFLNFPPLFHLAARLAHVPAGMQLQPNTSLLLAAWFGTFLTALNLFPVGQLDGGHVTYALLRRKAAVISRLGFYGCVGLIYFSPSWCLWALLLGLFGRQHPFTLDDDAPVGTGRAVLGVLTIAVFALCFLPSPIEWGTWSGLWKELANDLHRWLT